jgi:diacylglycerol kinase family enzyme
VAVALRDRIVVLVNSGAGTALGRPHLDVELADLFRDAGCNAEIVLLHDGQNPADAARTASARAAIVVAGGGDGTVCSVATGVLGSDAALGILPLGTLNHFAKDLGIPLDLKEAIGVIAAGHIEAVDLGQVNDHVFVNNASIGIYPSIVDARETLRGHGHRKWPAMAIATFRVLRHHRGVTVSVEIDGRRRTWRTPFVFIGNNEYAIDGWRLGGRARLDGGQLFVYSTPRIRARHLPMLLMKALIGRAGRSGDFEIVPATNVWIDKTRSGHVQVAYDGEVRPMKMPLHFQVCPKALRVVRPQR